MNKETERFFKSRIEGSPVYKEESLMFSDIIKDEEVILKKIEEEKKFTEYLPVYTLAAACGNFGEGASAEMEGWIKADGVGRLSRNMFVTKVTGKSMEPLIPDDSYCLFRTPVVGSRNNKIVLVQHNSITDPDTGGKYTVKKYTSKKRQGEDDSFVHEEITLHPLNPSHQPITIPDSEQGEFMVIAEFIKVVQ
jgi:phage repressor protein C with HTH and peptisase S24 domain